MNKRDILPLYAGRCKVLTNTGRVRNFHGIDDLRQTDPVIFPDCLPISRCQLILKRISDMNEDDCIKFVTKACGYRNAKEIQTIPADGGGWAEIRVLDEDDTTIIIEMGIWNIKMVLWLIQNGYALSDEWFTNGIAVEQ